VRRKEESNGKEGGPKYFSGTTPPVQLQSGSYVGGQLSAVTSVVSRWRRTGQCACVPPGALRVPHNAQRSGRRHVGQGIASWSIEHKIIADGPRLSDGKDELGDPDKRIAASL